jgi:predicted DNA-binding transcriptional regulator AlpA
VTVTPPRNIQQPTGSESTKTGQRPEGGDRLLTPKEAAAFLRLSVSFLAKARMRGDGPPYFKPGRAVRYRESRLIEWLKSRSRLSTSER